MKPEFTKIQVRNFTFTANLNNTKQFSQQVASKIKTNKHLIISLIGSTICPVKIFTLYMNKLNKKGPVLWQRPKVEVRNSDPVWYDNAPIGKDTLNNTMKNLSKNAGLSKEYRNHSIRATVVTNLDTKGFEARHIMATTGHKSEVSIKNYSRKCPSAKRREMSDALATSLIKNQDPQSPIAKKRKTEVTAIFYFTR